MQIQRPPKTGNPVLDAWLERLTYQLSKPYATWLADMSGEAAAAFDLNSQDLTGVNDVVIADAGNIGSVNDTDAIAISAAGVLGFSGQSGCSVYLSADQDIPNGELTTIEFDTEEDDVQSEFNTGTYTFTTGTTGIYQISMVIVTKESMADGEQLQIRLYKNAGIYTRIIEHNTVNTIISAALSVRMPLSATDTLHLVVYHDHTEARQLDLRYCRFSIAKIG